MILVTGATGRTGSESVRLLAAQHQPTRALVRDASRAPRGHVEVAVGDFDRPETLDEAMRGIDTVILISPAAGPVQEIAVVDSALRSGVKHIVKITNKGGADSPIDRRRAQAQIEAHLEATGLAHTLLRSNFQMQNLVGLAPTIKQTHGFVASVGDGQIGMIDARDVAAAAVSVATAPADHAGRTYWLTGPELVTYSDFARELGSVLGHAVEYRRITPDEQRAAMIEAGVPEAAASTTAQIFGLLAQGDHAWLYDDVESLTGTRPRSLSTFIADHVQAFI
jgi:uncharacterized protein YbjT (DUF2867 family)